VKYLLSIVAISLMIYVINMGGVLKQVRPFSLKYLFTQLPFFRWGPFELHLVLLLIEVVLIPGIFTELSGLIKVEGEAVFGRFPFIPVKDGFSDVGNTVAGYKFTGSDFEGIHGEFFVTVCD